MNRNDILTQLSPVLFENVDFARLLLNLHTISATQIATAQANALSPTWHALSQHPSAQHSATSLHRMFRDITRYYKIVQLQRPILCCLQQNVTQELERYLATPTLQKYGQGKIGYFGRATTFGLKNVNIHPLPPSYKYSFLLFTKNNAHPHTVSMPIIALDDDMLKQTIAASGPAGASEFFNALQDALAISNHDYIHHATSTLINPYLVQDELADKTRNEIDAMFDTDLMQRNWLREMYLTQSSPDPYVLNLEGYRFVSSTLEAHALMAHKKLYEITNTTQRDVATINTVFDHLETLLPKTNTPNELGAYYTLVMYDRLLATLPYTHPVIQTLETRAAALPIPHNQWRDVVSHYLNAHPHLPKIKKRPRQNLKRHLSKFGITPKWRRIQTRPTSTQIRIAAHMADMPMLEKLHYDPANNADKTAIPDLQKIINVTMQELSLLRRHERISRINRAFAMRKNRPC